MVTKGIVLRGGRLTKVGGKLVSMGPQVGEMVSGLAASVKPIALAVSLLLGGTLFSSAALAGSCSPVVAGVSTCSGAASGGDVAQNFTIPPGGSISLSTLPGFGITALTSADDGIRVAGPGNVFGVNQSFIDMNASLITGDRYGIYVGQTVTGSTTVESTGTVTGKTQSGISANNGGSGTGTNVTVKAARASGDIYGVYAENNGSGSTNITTTNLVEGVGNFFFVSGISAYNRQNATSITVNAADTTGGSGIKTRNRGTGLTTINANGATTGNINSGIEFANGVGGGVLNVASTSVIKGKVSGVTGLSSETPTTLGSVVINNAGSIRNLSGLSTDLAIKLSENTSSITNNTAGGLLTGTVDFAGSAGSNIFNNNANATWNVAGGSSNFDSNASGLGSNKINNSGLIQAAAPFAGSIVTTTFANVGTFTNSAGGVLSLGNALPGDTATLGGIFASAGGGLNLDVVLNDGASMPADQLAISGDSLGGTPTVINLTNVGGAGALTTGNGILLVSVSGTNSAANAFALPGPGYVDLGGYRYRLVQVGKNWYLQSTSVQLSKLVQPVGDPGVFSLSVTGGNAAGGTNPQNGVTFAGNGTASNTTGPIAVDAGTAITFSETAALGTTLSDYTTTVACTDGAAAVTPSSTDLINAATRNAVFASPAAGVFCTFTNVRSPTLILQKNIAARLNADDQFALSIGGTPNNTANTNGATTGLQPITASVVGVAGSSYSLNEAMAAGSPSSLLQYTQTVSCVNTLSTANGGTDVSGVTALAANIALKEGDAITCTIVNTPKVVTPALPVPTLDMRALAALMLAMSLAAGAWFGRQRQGR